MEGHGVIGRSPASEVFLINLPQGQYLDEKLLSLMET